MRYLGAGKTKDIKKNSVHTKASSEKDLGPGTSKE